MTERWKPQKMSVSYDPSAERWVAFNEAGEFEHFLTQPEALEWVFKNWDWCGACEQYVPYRNEICRCCGREWGTEDSAYAEIRHSVADALMAITGADAPAVWAEQRDNYLLDAEDVIALLPHLLPLDIREAMFDETEEERNAA